MRLPLLCGLLALPACITADVIIGGPCHSTSECKPGLFCSNGTCEQLLEGMNNTTVGTTGSTGMTGPSDMLSSNTCDASHPCASGCCDAGACVAENACSGEKKCANGICPARCDTGSGGAGCVSGCCDPNGACAPGTLDAACGRDGATCSLCGAGTTCSDQACHCPSCGSGQVCGGAGACVDCSSSPCTGTTPYCDGASSHVCEPCTLQPQGELPVCSGGTPYCTASGACSSTADSDAACARVDATRPTLTSPGVCGCNGTSTCPRGLTCNGTTNACNTACTPGSSTDCAGGSTAYCSDGTQCVGKKQLGDTTCSQAFQCATGSCGCHDNLCNSHVCSNPCAICQYAEDADGANCTGAIYPETSAPAALCGGNNACDGGTGAASCRKANGQTCSASSECASNNCIPTTQTGGGKICATATHTCTVCHYSDDGGAHCTATIQAGQHDGMTCVGNLICNGPSAQCKNANGVACNNTGDCESTHCECADDACSSRVCAPSACGLCGYAPSGGACVSRTHGETCGVGLQCTTTGVCTSPGTPDCTCSYTDGEGCLKASNTCTTGATTHMTGCATSGGLSGGSCTPPGTTCYCSF